MIRHVVQANFKAEIGQQERDEFTKKLIETLPQIPGTRDIVVSQQALKEQGTTRYGAALFIDFDNEIALKGYLDHPLHRASTSQMPAMFSEFLVSDYLY